MATLNVYQAFSLAVDGVLVEGGSRSAPTEITVTGTRKDLYKSLTTATTWDAWVTDAEEALTDFDFLYLLADQNVWLELTVDQNAGVGREEIALEIQANRPFMLLSDDAYALYSQDFATATEDVIDRIRIRNISGNTASVRLILIT